MSAGQGPDGHGKPKCGAAGRSGRPCTRPAGWGTDHAGYGVCKNHGGSTPSHVAHAQKVMAAQAVKSFGIKSDLPPRAALLEEHQWSHGHVLWLRDVVQAIDRDALTWGVSEEHEKTASEFPGVDVKKLAKPSVWLELYYLERKLHLEYGKTIETLKIEQGWLDQVARNAELMRQVLLLVLGNRGVAVDDGLGAEIQAAIAQVAGGKTIEGRVA